MQEYQKSVCQQTSNQQKTGIPVTGNWKYGDLILKLAWSNSQRPHLIAKGLIQLISVCAELPDKRIL